MNLLDRYEEVVGHQEVHRLRQLAKRLQGRRGHYMPATLLDSQLATLEEPEDAITVDVEGTPDQIVAEIVQKLAASS